MRKMVFGRHLSRGRGSRIALFRSLIRALVASGKIVTTRAKAKAIIPLIDKLITTAKKNSLSGRRKVLSRLGNDRETTDLIFLKVLPSFSNRSSGFTRIVLLPSRPGDSAQMARLEWSETIEMKKKAEKTKNENIPTKRKRN
ncbi:50S ribosomal protein L17 [Candidatus Woesebacteria bacterium]|nr:50S ribosomal protein L17 [Candidatus Woesebacteria bacterium]